MSINHLRIAVIVAAVVAGAAMRLVPHPLNFAPIGAMALFSGAHLRPRWLSFAVPIGALLASDAVLGFYPHMEFVYGSFALIVLLGSASLRRLSPLRVGVASVSSSVLFFAVSNFGVWLDFGSYPHTIAGVIACYVAAIPFFWNTLAGDLFYSTLLFGGLALLELGMPRLRTPVTSSPSGFF